VDVSEDRQQTNAFRTSDGYLIRRVVLPETGEALWRDGKDDASWDFSWRDIDGHPAEVGGDLLEGEFVNDAVPTAEDEEADEVSLANERDTFVPLLDAEDARPRHEQLGVDESRIYGEDGPAEVAVGPQLEWVAIYLVGLAYGGPEEGGWYYETGGYVSDPDVYQKLGMAPRAFLPEPGQGNETADDFCRKMQERADEVLNVGEYAQPVSNVNSPGRYEAHVFEGPVPPTHFPPKRPHYE
jgi:hypothetical protein